jgi:hypothetical protein
VVIFKDKARDEWIKAVEAEAFSSNFDSEAAITDRLTVREDTIRFRSFDKALGASYHDAFEMHSTVTKRMS